MIMGEALGINQHVIATHLIKKAGLAHKTAHTGAVTLIQRFGSALNLRPKFGTPIYQPHPEYPLAHN